MKKIGNICEKNALEFLKERGWWCHLFASTTSGQPCDVVAIRNNVAMLVDIKHCNQDTFSFARVESNQESCFAYAEIKGNTHTGFVIYFEKQKDFYFLSYKDFVYLKKQGRNSVKFTELPKWGAALCTL